MVKRAVTPKRIRASIRRALIVNLILLNLLLCSQLQADDAPDAALLEFLAEGQQDGEHWVDPIQVQEMTSNEQNIDKTQAKPEQTSQEQGRD